MVIKRRKLLNIIYSTILIMFLSSTAYSANPDIRNDMDALYKNEDYEEIIGILQDKEITTLKPEELIYLGKSYLFIGEYQKGVSILEKSLKVKPTLEAGETLIKIYVQTGKYDRAKRVYAVLENSKIEIPERLKLLVESAPQKRKVKISTAISTGYDSNPTFLPEDTPSNSGSTLFIRGNLKINKNWNTFSTGIYINTYYPIEKEYKNISYATAEAYLSKSWKNLKIKPSIYHIFVDNSSYATGIKMAMLKEVGKVDLIVEAGYEHNYENRDMNALYISANTNYENFLLSLKYKNYNNWPYKAEIKTKYTKRIRLNSVKAKIEPAVKFTYREDESKSITPAVSFEIEKDIFKKLKLFLLSSLEKSYGEGNLENDYSKFTLEIGIKGTF